MEHIRREVEAVLERYPWIPEDIKCLLRQDLIVMVVKDRKWVCGEVQKCLGTARIEIERVIYPRENF